MKISIKKRPKNCIFSKGLHHGFCKKKIKRFPSIVSPQNGSIKRVVKSSETKKGLIQV